MAICSPPSFSCYKVAAMGDIMQDSIGQTCPFGFVTYKENDIYFASTVEFLSPQLFYSEIILPPITTGNPVMQ